jgi:hypothetical protein
VNPNPTTTEKKKVVLDSTQRTNLKLSAGAVAASLVWATPIFAFSLLVGAVLEGLNFHGLRRSAQFMFGGEIAGSRAWIGVFALRFSLLAIGICTALYFGADPVGLLIGLSLMIPAAVIEAWRSRPAIDPQAPALDADDPSWDDWNPWLARERPEAEEESP